MYISVHFILSKFNFFIHYKMEYFKLLITGLVYSPYRDVEKNSLFQFIKKGWYNMVDRTLDLGQEVMVKIFLSATAVQCHLNVAQSLYIAVSSYL